MAKKSISSLPVLNISKKIELHVHARGTRTLPTFGGSVTMNRDSIRGALRKSKYRYIHGRARGPQDRGVDKQKFVSHSSGETERLGVNFSALLRKGDVVLLSGELGAGKTTFVKGIARGFGINKVVRSSSFIIANEYLSTKGMYLYHIDLYRLGEGDMIGLGLEEYLSSDGICVIEWPEKMGDVAGMEHYKIGFKTVSDNERAITIQKNTCG